MEVEVHECPSIRKRVVEKESTVDFWFGWCWPNLG